MFPSNESPSYSKWNYVEKGLYVMAEGGGAASPGSGRPPCRGAPSRTHPAGPAAAGEAPGRGGAPTTALAAWDPRPELLPGKGAGPSSCPDGRQDARVTARSHLAAKATGTPGDQWDPPPAAASPQTPWVSDPAGPRLCSPGPRPWRGTDPRPGLQAALRPGLAHLSSLRPGRWPEAWPARHV